MRRLLRVVTAVVAVLAAAPVRADRRTILIPDGSVAAPKDVPSRFILDFGLGPAFVYSGAKMNGIRQSVSGIGPQFTGGTGWVATPDLLVGAEYSGVFVYAPGLDTRARSNDGTGLIFSSHALGPTVRWYFGPDLWVGATPAVTYLKLSDNDLNGFGWRIGYGLRTSFGTVWRLDTRWLLNVSGQLLVGRNGSSAPRAPTWTTASAGLVANFSFR